MTPRERAMAVYQEWSDIRGRRNHGDFLRIVSTAITYTISDQTAALQAALEDLARTKQERDRYKGAASYVYSTRRRLRLLYEVVTGQPMRVSLSDSEAVDEFDAAVRRLKFDFTVMQDAREELARVKAERDHVAGKLAGCKECGGSGYVVSYAYDGYPEGTPCDHGNVLAAHDRAVAARVLRYTASTITDPAYQNVLRKLAFQYERGEREVPSEYSR